MMGASFLAQASFAQASPDSQPPVASVSDSVLFENVRFFDGISEWLSEPSQAQVVEYSGHCVARMTNRDIKANIQRCHTIELSQDYA